MLVISLKQVPKKEQHKHAHSLVSSCLGAIGIDYKVDETPVIQSEYGKPSLADYPDIHYNISHADGIAVCMVSDTECGIDCEGVRKYSPKVAKRVFSESEKAVLESTPEIERDLLFFRLWTLKEAYVKTIGIGISYPLNTVEFSFNGEEINTPLEGYTFKQYILKDGKYVVSICEKITHS